MKALAICAWLVGHCCWTGLCQLEFVEESGWKTTKPCRCVPVYSCDYRTLGPGSGPNIRVDNGGCPNLLDVCCPVGDTQPENRVSVTTPSCGVSQVKQVGTRITGDSETDYAQFPWMAALLGPGRKFICGGSLIHPQVVLTAAHCVTNMDHTELTVRLGEWDAQVKREPLPVQDRAVREITSHEQFTPGPLYNDIALLFLESPADPADNVGTICLPQANEDMDNRNCVASGWGKDAFEGRHQAVLKRVDLSIVPREKCLSVLRGTRLGEFFRLHLSFLCAGGEEGQDTCQGDGGGPLMCPTQKDPSVYEQAGTVSWGLDCGRRAPAAYTNVALFRSWVDLQLLRRGLSV